MKPKNAPFHEWREHLVSTDWESMNGGALDEAPSRGVEGAPAHPPSVLEGWTWGSGFRM